MNDDLLIYFQIIISRRVKAASSSGPYPIESQEGLTQVRTLSSDIPELKEIARSGMSKREPPSKA